MTRPSITTAIAIALGCLSAGCGTTVASIKATKKYVRESLSKPLADDFDVFVRYEQKMGEHIHMWDPDNTLMVVFHSVEGNELRAKCSTSKKSWNCTWWSDGENLYTVWNCKSVYWNAKGLLDTDCGTRGDYKPGAVLAFEHSLEGQSLTLDKIILVNLDTQQAEAHAIDNYPSYIGAVDGRRVLMAVNDELLRRSLARKTEEPSPPPAAPAPKPAAPPPKPAAPDPPPAPAAATTAERLKKLKELHEQELITDDEYDERRKEILDEL